MISDATLLAWTKSDAADTAMLRILEQAAVAAAEVEAGEYYGVTTNITETISFRGWPLQLANEPTGGVITSLDEWDGSAWATVDAASYYVDGSFIWPTAAYSYSPNPLYTNATKRYRAVYPAGYTVDGADANVWDAPDVVQMAVLFTVGHWNANRESVVVGTTATEVPDTAQALLAMRRRVTV